MSRAVLLAGVIIAAGLAPGGEPEWLAVRYGDVVDGRQLSHSGESVAALLGRLGGRALPPAGERPADRLAHTLLEPLLEPYAFVLPDAVDSLEPVADPPFVEIGGLWVQGEAQPAWAELLRARRLVVESDGSGRLRLFLPVPPGTQAGIAGGDAARLAYESAWPVLRHVFAAERRRLATEGPAAALRVEVRAYRHAPERSEFELGRQAYRTEVTDTASDGRRPPLELAALRAFLDAGLELEGARLEPDGTLRLLGSQPARRPTLLGRPLGLADFAVAYRAVFHGGLAEPYMSLDRGLSPQTSIVNYGGRLRDTALGMVSLLCDIRFKTFSLGLDITTGDDVREVVRASVPGFRTHLERFSADAGSAGVLGQQTRLWFYPDTVELTVAPEGDALVMRRVRMAAASERVQGETLERAGDDPPWTRATVRAINDDYGRLAAHFPELADLDQVVRLLSLFTWLREAAAAGLAVPDLDVLLDVELPAMVTPRVYPQMLAFNALPGPGSAADVVTIDRLAVGAALDRLVPQAGRPLAARSRFERAVQALDPGDPQQAALRGELEKLGAATLDETSADLLAYRAERVVMHELVLGTLPAERAAPLGAREQAGERLRVFSVGIGGLDLGMGQALERARGRSLGLVARSGSARPAATRPQADAPRPEWRADVAPTGGALPPHGRAVAGARETQIEASAPGEPRWVAVRAGMSGDAATSRKAFFDTGGRAERFERLEQGRLLRYGVVRDGATARVRVDSTAGPAAPPAGVPGLPGGVAWIQIGGGSDDGLAPRVRVVVEAGESEQARREEVDVARPALRRLVLGPEVDRTPGQPLPLAELPPALGEVETLMLLLRPSQRSRPWDGGGGPVPGEEDPLRLARALGAWARAGAAAAPAIVATDPGSSASRWSAAPALGGAVPLLLPVEGFDVAAPSTRERLARAWVAGPVVSELPAALDARLIVVVSAEPPARFAGRLRELASRPALRGKLLAAWSLAGPLREDLPAWILSESRIAAFGLADSTVLALRRVEPDLAAYGAAVRAAAAGSGVERVPGPFLWFY